MTSTAILGQWSDLHEMQVHLLKSVPAGDAARQFHPRLASLNWYFGRGVYLELYWLREMLEGDDDLTRRIHHLFRPDRLTLPQQCAQLPPVDHLLHWGTEIRDEHLRRLATPGALPDHALLHNDRLSWHLLQEQAKRYETMLTVLNQRMLKRQTPCHACASPLQAEMPRWETKELSQGHYRIGARNDPRAYDNELPPQAIELSGFRIALTPVSNAQYLAFMQAGGYRERSHWDQAGWQWLDERQSHHPEYWRRDNNGNWCEIAINGDTHLPAQEPVTGISLHEARAFANWIGKQSSNYAGAVVQHEYQWEMAARTGVLTHTGRAWEWCSNAFHGYPEFQPFPDTTVSADDFDQRHFSLRGGSLHTQPLLRRSSFRHRALPSDHHHFTTARLVFPARHHWN
ncbi:MAG: SUMF1/EgtB/PvdO family nonheme iron enzyme [Candidatus Thiodiazotropha sp. (ex Dulcina madagascariensis)]|nr:SUMF1/EgtB/PvdO family nonheme iron enzyme [Candidatus Thiodiazotropha sp. (ex Dulcina madagascariensis)]